MIKIENTRVWGFEGALRGMRNPYMSHEKSDSTRCDMMYPACRECPVFKDYKCAHLFCTLNVFKTVDGFVIGKADMTLAKKLIKAGPEHRKFLRMIHVQCDVLAPRYWWAEMDKYKYVEANSSSTMHLITKRELTLEDFSRDGAYNTTVFEKVVESLNAVINLYNNLDSGETKEACFRAIKQLLPESFNQLRTIDTTYEALLNIHHQRKNHRLSEWKEFCQWVESLPYMDEFLEVKDAD